MENVDIALAVEKLNKSYSKFSLENISFALPKGHIMGFVGQNGAGKTTTIRLILNMISRDSGTVHVFGKDNIIDEDSIKQDIAVVFDDTFFVESWTALDVEKALQGFYTNWDSALFHQYIKGFELPTNKQVKDLSRGMGMKLMLAVALSHNAQLLILDEPTSGIDPVARDELLEILREYVEDGQKSIFFSTHITTDLEKIADYITLIDRGSLFYTGTLENLLKDFYFIKGPVADLTPQLRKIIIGLSIYTTGFQGLIPAVKKDQVKGIALEVATIEEILVHISKQKKNE